MEWELFQLTNSLNMFKECSNDYIPAWADLNKPFDIECAMKKQITINLSNHLDILDKSHKKKMKI